MKDTNTREVMSRLYRIIEKYEEPPGVTGEDPESYFSRAMVDIKSVYDDYSNNEFAKTLSIAVYDALGKRFKKYV